MEYFQRVIEKFRPAEVSYTHKMEHPTESESDIDNSHVISRKRKFTNLYFFIVHISFCAVFVYLLTECIINGDIKRITRGYDNCGNVCGKINNFNLEPNSSCKALDMRNKPFLHISGFEHHCVTKCDVNMTALDEDRCIPKNHEATVAYLKIQPLINKLSRDFLIYSKYIICLMLTVAAFSFASLAMVKFMPKVFIWTVFATAALASLVGAVYFGYLATKTLTYLPYVVVFAITTLVLLIIIAKSRERIPLVLQLFEESGKAIDGVSLLIFEPILVCFLLIITCSAWLEFTLWIESAGIPSVDGSTVKFEKNFLMHTACWYNHFVMIWMVGFIYGLQNMIVGGAISAWFFSRNKSALDKPFYNSFYNTIRYHLGIASAGSLIIPFARITNILLKLLRLFLRLVMNKLYLGNYYEGVERRFLKAESYFKIFTNNAYIITAMQGHPFKEAGEHATELTKHWSGGFFINFVAAFIPYLAKVLITAASVLVGMYFINDAEDTYSKRIILAVIGILTYLISSCFLELHVVTRSTLFVCLCKDYKMSTETSNPHFMTQNLKDFAENFGTPDQTS